MDDFYFVVTAGEDGDVYINRYTKAELQQQLDDKNWGSDVQFLTVGKSHINVQEGGAGIYIFKGTEVTPQEQAVVTKWSV